MDLEKAISDWVEFLKIDFDNPQFEKAHKVNDWRNYVPDELIEVWPLLSKREKVIIYKMGDFQADKEDWD